MMIDIISATAILDTLNPLKHVSQAGYTGFWATMFQTFLSGIWARIFAGAFLFMAFWLGVYRRQFGLGIFLFVLSVFVTYLGGVIGVMFWWAS